MMLRILLVSVDDAFFSAAMYVYLNRVAVSHGEFMRGYLSITKVAQQNNRE